MSGKGRNMAISREPQWSPDEIKLFFQGINEFQKFPMQWNLIASKIKGRDSSMVQALYTMNKSYLSLKDATAEGLMLVMKDRYDNASELERQVLLQSSKRRTPQSCRRTPKKIKPSPLRQIIEATSYTTTPPNPISKRKRKPSPLYDRHNQPPSSPYKPYSAKLSYMSPSAPTSSPLISGTVIGSPQPTNPTTPSTAINNQQSSTTNHYTSSISQYTNQLSNCLSMKMRFWCFYEWYYSTIDRDYFRRNEFKSYLRTKGLQDITHLTRREWSLLRSFMGIPRRMSKKFLDEERARLEQYRQNCCALMMKRPPIYADESVYPSIVPQPILVGEYVTAIHPIYKTICNGAVLTSDTYNGNYQIQFDNAKYGVHLCNITDIITFPNTSSTNYDAEVAKHPSLYQTLSKATILLDRKEAIIRQICKMNNEFASQLIQKNPSTVVIYNWLLFNLNETNIILQSVMNDVISFADSSQLSSNCIVNDLLFTCQNSSKLVIKNIVKQLKNELINESITKVLPTEAELDEIFIKPREPENPQIYRLILNCITLLLGMKTAVDREGIPNSTISNLIETSLKEIEPVNDESLAIFKTISDLIYRFKAYCVHEEIVLPISPSRAGRNDLASLPRPAI